MSGRCSPRRRLADALHLYDNAAGFRRTDALTRIGNAVFGTYMKIDANYAVANAPVRYPQIWDASWFDWIQYNSSIPIRWSATSVKRSAFARVAMLYGPDAGKFDEFDQHGRAPEARRSAGRSTRR